MAPVVACGCGTDAVQYVCVLSCEDPPEYECLLPPDCSDGKVVQLPPVARPQSRWVWLAILWVACTICSGLVPGMAVFIDMFAGAGVYASVCDGKEGPCDEQFMVLSSIFNVANGVTIFSLLPIGLIFDRYGAHHTAVLGALLVLVGLALLELPLLGAQYGFDRWTCNLLPIAVFVTDVGSMLNSQCMLGIVWHFPGKQAFIISLSNSTYQAASLLPLLLGFLMDQLGSSLPITMALYMVMVAFGLLVCHACTPSQTEFYEEAKRVLGMPLPPPPKQIECCSMMRKGNAVIRQNLRDHLFTILLSSLGLTYAMMYQSLAGDYGKTLFGAESDGKRLAQLFASTNALVGGAIAPMGISIIEHCGIFVLASTLLLCHCGAFATIAVPTWPAQAGTCFCVVAFMALFLCFVMKYLLAYSAPNRIGVVQGLMMAYAMLYNVPILLGYQAWIQMMPNTRDRIALPLTAAAAMASISMGGYVLHFCIVGFPAQPALLPDDEVELARPFGCKDLDEVCYVVRMEGERPQLLRILSCMDPDAFARLLARVDAERLAEKLAERNVEELAEMMEAGPMGQGGAGSEEHVVEEEAGDGEAEEEVRAEEEKEEAKSATRVQSERFVALVRTGDKAALREMLMAASADDIWNGYLDMGQWLDSKERRSIEQEFDRLVPGREFASLLRQRPELKTVVTRMVKHHVQRMIRGRRRRA